MGLGPPTGWSTDAERRRGHPAAAGRALTLVVDASIVVPVALKGGWPDALTTEPLLAPPLMWSEATSALHELGYRGEVDPDVATHAIARLADLGIERSDEPRIHAEASRIARSLGWAKTYDAEYIALALLRGIPLLTRDARLLRGATRVVVAIGPDDLTP